MCNVHSHILIAESVHSEEMSSDIQHIKQYKFLALKCRAVELYSSGVALHTNFYV